MSRRGTRGNGEAGKASVYVLAGRQKRGEDLTVRPAQRLERTGGKGQELLLSVLVRLSSGGRKRTKQSRRKRKNEGGQVRRQAMWAEARGRGTRSGSDS